MISPFRKCNFNEAFLRRLLLSRAGKELIHKPICWAKPATALIKIE
jgi:hypothetical protein